MDSRSQALGGKWSHLQAFCGIRGSSCARLLVAYMDRRVEAFGGRRGLTIASFWWLMWIVVCKPLVAYINRRSQAFRGRWSRLQAFGGIHGSSFTSLWWLILGFTSLRWLAWIAIHKNKVADGVIYKPFVAYVDRRVHVFGGIRGSSFVSP